MKRVHITLLLLLLSLLSVAHGASAVETPFDVNLLENPGFEMLGSDNQLPPGWQLYRGRGPNQWSIVQAPLFDGEYALQINTEGQVNAGIQSIPLPAKPGEVYRAAAHVLTTPGSTPVLYLEFYDAGNQQVGMTKVTATGADDDWKPLSLTLEAPAGTASVFMYFYSNAIQSPGKVWWDNASLVKLSSR